MVITLEQIFKYIPNYLSDVVTLLAGPRKFLVSSIPKRRKKTSTNKDLVPSLTFYALSFLIATILSASSLGKFVDVAVPHMVRILLLTIVQAGLIRLAWKFVGGRLQTRDYIILAGFMTGMVVILIAPVLIIGDVVQSQYRSIIDREVLIWLRMTILAVGFGGILVWVTIAWGALQTLNKASVLNARKSFLYWMLLNLPLLLLWYPMLKNILNK